VHLTKALAAGAVPPSSFLRRHGDTMAAAAARLLGVAGPRVTIDTACASGAHAVIEAYRAVARGEVAAMVAGAGSGLVVPVTILAFARIGALTTNADPARASRPFDRLRDGFVLGEGAAALVLEPLAAAQARHAHVYAVIAGAATTVNAHSLTEPSPGGDTEAAAIRLAIAEARVAADAVDYVAAHGTSTPRNDLTETLAIKQALGARAYEIPVSSHKGQLGHTLPAAGAVNVVIAAMAIATQRVPPTAHLDQPDPACDLDYVPHRGRPAAVRVAVANAFAFGGQNAVVVLRQADDVKERRAAGGAVA
jgi:3-oxoacyl-[acyl-carrier-protein] synthase II